MAKITLESLAQASAPSNKSMSARCVNVDETRKVARIRYQLTNDGVVGDPWLETCPLTAIDHFEGECWVTVQQTNRKTKEVTEKSYLWKRA